MGSQQSIIYSATVPGQKESTNSTKIRRHPDYIDGLLDSSDQELKTIQQILMKSFKTFSNNPCIGSIKVTKPASEGQKEQRTVTCKTYQQIQKLSETLHKAIQDLNLSPVVEQVKGLPLRFIGIFSKTRSEWLQVEITTKLRGFCIIPIYDTLGVENIPYILNHTNLTTLFCSRDSLDILLKCQNLGKVKNIVCFDSVNEDILNKFKQKQILIHNYQELLNKYKNSDVKAEPRILKPQDVVSFCYTSGTTGPPKGAMLSSRNFAAFTGVLKSSKSFHFNDDDVHLSYLPLAHVFENVCVIGIFTFGGRIIAFGGDVRKLRDDLALVKPTFFMSVPRLYNRFADAIKDKFNKTQGWSKTILDKALTVKLNNVHSNGGYTHKLYDRLVFNRTKQLFGGRCRFLVSGSAPITSQVHSFMKVISCAPLMQGYGQTQSLGASFVTDPRDRFVGHVGGPSSMAEYKLVDIPEMNYTHNDKDEEGRSAPRGEVCIRGPGIFAGYYKDVQKTKQTIDDQGFLHTGDVGIILAESGALKLIDRKKNIFKLQQGQYIAAQKVEGIYTKRQDYVKEIFLHGDSTQSFCVAIITPVKSIIESIAKSKNIEGSFEQLCNNKEVRTEFLSQLNSFSKKQGLQGFEQPKNIFLDPKGFVKKGILTSTLKLQRFQAKNVYKPQIDAMYKQGVLGGKNK